MPCAAASARSLTRHACRALVVVQRVRNRRRRRRPSEGASGEARERRARGSSAYDCSAAAASVCRRLMSSRVLKAPAVGACGLRATGKAEMAIFALVVGLRVVASLIVGGGGDDDEATIGVTCNSKKCAAFRSTTRGGSETDRLPSASKQPAKRSRSPSPSSLGRS